MAAWPGKSGLVPFKLKKLPSKQGHQLLLQPSDPSMILAREQDDNSEQNQAMLTILYEGKREER
jgi:hypothetical protein